MPRRNQHPPRPERDAAILADIQARADGTLDLGRNAIARKHGVSFDLVTRIAQEAGIVDAFDRRRTARATADRQADMRARRVELAQETLEEAAEALARLSAPYQWVGNGRDGVDTRELPQPDAVAFRNLATAYAVLVDKHLALDKHDLGSDEAAEGRSLIKDFMSAVTESVRAPE